jgi:ribosome-binding factor A
MDSHRTERVSEALREELAEMIAYELSDPRIGDVIVTEVLVSPDRKHAQVRLHLSDEDRKKQASIQALEGARHFLRREIAHRLNLFRVRELHFESDVLSTEAGCLEHFLKRIRRGRPRVEEHPPS